MFTINLGTFEKIIERQLDSEAMIFIRLGKSLIINSNYIYYINVTKQQLILSDTSFTEKFRILVSFAALLIGIVIFINKNNKSDYYFEPEENTIIVNNLPENPNSDTIKSYIERLEEIINDVPLYIYIPHNYRLG